MKGGVGRSPSQAPISLGEGDPGGPWRPYDLLPGACIEFLRIAGSELGDPIVDEQLSEGPLPDLLPLVKDKVADHNRTGVDFTSGSLERRTSAYSQVAIQQILRNAVMHRTYEGTHNPLRVTRFDDRLEIVSRGGLFGVVTRESFGASGVFD